MYWHGHQGVSTAEAPRPIHPVKNVHVEVEVHVVELVVPLALGVAAAGHADERRRDIPDELMLTSSDAGSARCIQSRWEACCSLCCLPSADHHQPSRTISSPVRAAATPTACSSLVRSMLRLEYAGK